MTSETFQIRDVNIIRLCCLQLERCSSRDSEELWPLELMYSDIFHIVFILIQGAHTHTHTHTHLLLLTWTETNTHTHTPQPQLVGPGWCPVSLAYEAVAADGVHSSPDCHTLLGSHHYWLPLISLSLSLTLCTFFPFDFPLLSSPLSLSPRPRSLSFFFSHLPLYLTPSFLLFFLPPSSLCRVYLPRFVHVRDADQDVRSGHPALLPLLIQLLRLCGECAHTHTHTHTHSNWVKKQIMPVTIRFWWRTQRSI